MQNSTPHTVFSDTSFGESFSSVANYSVGGVDTQQMTGMLSGDCWQIICIRSKAVSTKGWKCTVWLPGLSQAKHPQTQNVPSDLSKRPIFCESKCPKYILSIFNENRDRKHFSCVHCGQNVPNVPKSNVPCQNIPMSNIPNLKRPKS